MPLETSAEQPIPVRTVSRHIGEWIARLGRVWVEGQVAQLSRRPGSATCFLTLRDPVADVSISVTCPTRVLDAVVPPLGDGARIVVLAKPDYYLKRGSLSLSAVEIRPVGLGQLLARLEQLRALLAAEGLFAADRKRPLPFLPRAVGVICGRGSAAERDILEHARRRWPGVEVRVENVAVQGTYAVPEVIDALHRLDRDPDVGVIVITRGGGSVEDLLPFSEENLVRAVSACLTPVVSAIGHEQDVPAARPGRRRPGLDADRRRSARRARRTRGARRAAARVASGPGGRSRRISSASSTASTACAPDRRSRRRTPHSTPGRSRCATASSAPGAR